MASVAFAFGSFGDIVALIQILVDLTRTLRDGKAATEYRELIAELGSLQNVLENIKEEIIAPTMGAPILDRSSMNAIGLAVQRCHSLIKDFTDSTQGYGRSLMVGEPGSNLWDFWWGVNWRLLKKGAIADLREQLTQQKTAMILVLSLASSSSLHRMEQQLKQLSTVRAAHERYEFPPNIPLPVPFSGYPIEKFGSSGDLNNLSPFVQSPSPPSLNSFIHPDGDDFDDHMHAFPPNEAMPRSTATQNNHPYQLPLTPPDSAPLSPAPQPAKPGWRTVPKPKGRRPRIDTDVTLSPGLFGQLSPDSTGSNVGRPGGYGPVPPPPTSPASQIRPTVNAPDVSGAYVWRDGPPYIDTTHRQEDWNYSLPHPSVLNRKREIVQPEPRVTWRPSSAIMPSPRPLSPILDGVSPGLFGPRSPGSGLTNLPS